MVAGSGGGSGGAAVPELWWCTALVGRNCMHPERTLESVGAALGRQEVQTEQTNLGPRIGVLKADARRLSVVGQASPVR